MAELVGRCFLKLPAIATILLMGGGVADAQYAGRSGIRYSSEGSIFSVRRTSDWSPDRRDGRCRIRVRIDDESDVELRGDQIRIRVIRGGPGRDDGSECNAPLPTSGEIRNFRFRGIDGRGTPRLVQEPSRRNYYVAVVNVRDPKGGDEGYTFDLSWEWEGRGGDGGLFPNRPTRPWPPSSGGGLFPDAPGGGSLSDINTSVAGDGTLDDGSQRHNLTDASLRVRGNSCQITLTTDRRQRLQMSGRTSPNTPRCIIDSSNRGRMSGNAYVHVEGGRVRRIDLSGNLNGQNFSTTFTAR